MLHWGLTTGTIIMHQAPFIASAPLLQKAWIGALSRSYGTNKRMKAQWETSIGCKDSKKMLPLFDAKVDHLGALRVYYDIYKDGMVNSIEIVHSAEMQRFKLESRFHRTRSAFVPLIKEEGLLCAQPSRFGRRQLEERW